MKYLWILLIIAIGAFIYWSDQKDKTAEPAKDSSMVLAGQNAIYVADQLPGRKILVNAVILEKPGFVVIHAASGEAVGAVLGNSGLLMGRQQQKVEINLNEPVADNDALFAMIHLDNGDGKFDPAQDNPGQDSLGNDVMMKFRVDKNADPNVEVSL